MTDGIIRRCMFSRCKEIATYSFFSYEELTVYLCDKHTIRNIIHKTGYVERYIKK